ncbi:dynein light chain Tctex-type protein 2B [Sabethes cyaneus]|uniref:dynein light chain Tctex-type protein 2B n=1 Tax=Sabethes cyaneus TaxID=53552 RepID=UPI00237EE2C5|nr:dynein light chain Tctex-type protein 2B [Sabethes cyaneus]
MQDNTAIQPPPKAAKKKIVIMEPHEESGVEKRREGGKRYRKSIFPGFRDSIMMDSRRQSSVAAFGRMMDAAFPSLPSQRFTSRRSTMYLTPRFQNTYRLESRHPFKREKVEHIVDRYLRNFLDDHKYNPKRAKRLAEDMSVELKNLIKFCNYDRYRVLSVVTIGDKTSQDFKCVMRFVWDAEKDGYINFAYETPTYFVIATIFAVYYE